MDVTVIDNPAQHRYEIRAGEKIAGFTEYQPVAGDRVVFFHTRVDGSFQGKGIGSRLVREALDDVRARGLRVRAVCPYVKAWLERHPDYADLVLSLIHI